MEFIRDDKADINGTSLLFEITAYGEKVKELFGSFKGLRQTRAKYSDSVTIRHEPTGEVFTLYMCYGEWRIGGNPHKCTAAGKLAALVNPCKHGDMASKDGRTIIEERDAELRKRYGF